jgi:hypothetical protein
MPVTRGTTVRKMLDPEADIARRVWMTCTPCGSTAGLYLLASEPRFVWVQCPDCFARFWLDSGCGVGRPELIRWSIDGSIWPWT